MRIEVGQTYPVSVSRAFSYITDIASWPDYWPDFVRIEADGPLRWEQPGDRVTVVIRMLNRERALKMELESFEKDAHVTYSSAQQGLPLMHHERHFEAHPAGCEYRLVVSYMPRSGVRGIFDRTLLRRSVAGKLRQALATLEGQLVPCPVTP